MQCRLRVYVQFKNKNLIVEILWRHIEENNPLNSVKHHPENW